ncbi:MAG: tripartite tricarboxylate transporter permease [Rhodospirillales bacterium]|nr:tripartite tricarboxylate transporter permease [Rhodospirillales bacterium]
MENVVAGFGLILDPQVLLVIFVSALFGLFVGAVPGLTATMATALLVPITFFMDPVPSISAIVACTAMAICAGDIPGALLRIPGTPASAAYTDEAYAMTRRGQAEQALGAGLVCAAIGGLIGALVLVVAAPFLARIALRFSSFEYFWLAALGLTSSALVSSDERVRGAVSLLIGLFISTVGLDVTGGFPRFTFDVVELTGGVSFIPAMIGMFALSEILRNLSGERPPATLPDHKIGNPLAGIPRLLIRHYRNVLRGSTIGTIIGALPGAGGDMAAWVAYATAKRFSKTPEKFGTGHVEGIIEAGSANNSGLSSAWVPALVFGIPGDAVTAIAIGVLYMKGMNPGPTVFLQRPDMLYAVFICFFLANLLIIPFGYVAIKLARRILGVPRNILMPVILLFCVVGSFAINNTVFGIGVMLLLGLVAYVMECNRLPIAPVILGIVMGRLLESSFMTSMIIADGNLLGFFERPIAAGLGAFAILIWTSPLWMRLVRRNKTS